MAATLHVLNPFVSGSTYEVQDPTAVADGSYTNEATTANGISAPQLVALDYAGVFEALGVNAAGVQQVQAIEGDFYFESLSANTVDYTSVVAKEGPQYNVVELAAANRISVEQTGGVNDAQGQLETTSANRVRTEQTPAPEGGVITTTESTTSNIVEFSQVLSSSFVDLPEVTAANDNQTLQSVLADESSKLETTSPNTVSCSVVELPDTSIVYEAANNNTVQTLQTGSNDVMFELFELPKAQQVVSIQVKLYEKFDKTTYVRYNRGQKTFSTVWR